MFKAALLALVLAAVAIAAATPVQLEARAPEPIPVYAVRELANAAGVIQVFAKRAAPNAAAQEADTNPIADLQATKSLDGGLPVLFNGKRAAPNAAAQEADTNPIADLQATKSLDGGLPVLFNGKRAAPNAAAQEADTNPIADLQATKSLDGGLPVLFNGKRSPEPVPVFEIREAAHNDALIEIVQKRAAPNAAAQEADTNPIADLQATKSLDGGLPVLFNGKRAAPNAAAQEADTNPIADLQATKSLDGGLPVLFNGKRALFEVREAAHGRETIEVVARAAPNPAAQEADTNPIADLVATKSLDGGLPVDFN